MGEKRQPASAGPSPFQPQPVGAAKTQSPVQSVKSPAESPMHLPEHSSMAAVGLQADPIGLPVVGVF